MLVILLFFLAWTIVFIFLKFFESLSSGSLSRVLNSFNVTLKFGYVSVHTSRYNALIESIAHRRRNLFRAWFSVGIIFGFIGSFLSIYLLIVNLTQIFATSAVSRTSLNVTSTGHPTQEPPLPANHSYPLVSNNTNHEHHMFSDYQTAYARIPLLKHAPSFIPRFIYNIFIPTDHNAHSVLLNPSFFSMFDYAAMYKVKHYYHGLKNLTSLGNRDLDPDDDQRDKKGDCGGKRQHTDYRYISGFSYLINRTDDRNSPNSRYTLRYLMKRILSRDTRRPRRHSHFDHLRHGLFPPPPPPLRHRRFGYPPPSPPPPLYYYDPNDEKFHQFEPPHPPRFYGHDHPPPPPPRLAPLYYYDSRDGKYYVYAPLPPPPPPHYHHHHRHPPLHPPPHRRSRNRRHLLSIDSRIYNNSSHFQTNNLSVQVPTLTQHNYETYHNQRRLLAIPDKIPRFPRAPELGGELTGSLPDNRDDKTTNDEDDNQQIDNNGGNHETEQQKNQPPQSFGKPGLTPLIPGVTVPVGDLWFMLGTILIAQIVHELGHALAVAAEYGEVLSIGAFVTILLPGAFVKFYGIEDMPPKAQLRIWCAGAWHNAVTAIIAIISIKILPILVLPVFHHYGHGALVVDVPKMSPLYGNLNHGDIIMKIGNSPIVDGGFHFRQSIEHLHTTSYSIGFCISSTDLKTSESADSNCCPQFLSNEHSHEELNNEKNECYKVMSLIKRYVCLDTSNFQFNQSCHTSADCRNINGGTRKEKHQCVVPILEDNKQLIDIVVKSKRSNFKKNLDGSRSSILHFFYEGYPIILGTSVTVSSYVPRLWEYMPLSLLKLISQVDMPNLMERFLQYFASISLGLAIMNMAPVLYLDGEASFGLFVRLIFRKWSMKRVKRVRATMLLFGSLLLILNLTLSLLYLE